MQIRTARLTQTYVQKLGLQKPGHVLIVRDEDLGGFHLRVSHRDKVYKLSLTVRENGSRVTRGFTLGKASVIRADDARKRAEDKVRLRDRGELAAVEAPKPVPEKVGTDVSLIPLALIPNSKKRYFEADIDNDSEAYREILKAVRARYAEPVGEDDDPAVIQARARRADIPLIDAFVLFKEVLHSQNRSKRTVAFYQDHVKRNLSQWHSTPLRSISANNVRSLHAKITASGRKATANQVVTTGGAIYTFALKGERIPGLDPLSPWSGYRLMNKIRARQTGLGSKALASWHETILQLSPLLRAANEFALFSALRLRNLVSLRWSQVNFEECYIFIEGTKSDVDFKLPLSAPMIEILKAARDASREVHEINAETWVFASDKSATGHIMDLKNPNAKHHTPVSAHALRHTWRGIADEVRIPATHSKILMNHSVPSDVHSEYLTVESMFDQLRESQDLVSARIMQALPSGKAEVRHAA